MAGLAPGGWGPVLTLFAMGGSTLIIGAIIDPLAGLLPLLGMLCLMASVFVGYFWRDPDRPVPRESGILISPADGHVMFVRRERATGRRPSTSERTSATIESDQDTGDWWPEPLDDVLGFATEQRFEAVNKGEERENDVWRLAIFMSPLDVHVNRAPEAGVVERMELRIGKGRRRGPFVKAYRKESEFNERVRSVFRLEDGVRVEVTQISGALARTILPYVSEGDALRRGQRFGMIRLGSRVDVRVPADIYSPCVVSAEDKVPSLPKGEAVVAGRSVVFRHRTRNEEE